MILHENGFIRLDYEASTDVLYAECPDIQEFDLLQIHRAFGIIVETIRGYDIKNFIIDSRRTVIDVSHEDYKAVMDKFTRDLMATRLQKLARLVTGDAAREKQVESYAKEVRAEMKPSIEFRNFTSKEVALEWLLSE